MAALAAPPSYPYEVLEGVEDPLDYEQGGFHPSSIGDTFRDGRYRIIHKLGFGGHSTIWLAKDEGANRYVAMKFAAANSSVHGEHENRTLTRLINTGDHHPGRQYVPSVLDHSTISGPSGLHACLVTNPARLSLRNAKEDYSWLSLGPVSFRAIAAQLVEAVCYIHSQGVVVHGGELTPSHGSCRSAHLPHCYRYPPWQPAPSFTGKLSLSHSRRYLPRLWPARSAAHTAPRR